MTLYVIRERDSKLGQMFYVRHSGPRVEWVQNPIGARQFLSFDVAADTLADLRSRQEFDDCQVIPLDSN